MVADSHRDPVTNQVCTYKSPPSSATRIARHLIRIYLKPHTSIPTTNSNHPHVNKGWTPQVIHRSNLAQVFNALQQQLLDDA